MDRQTICFEIISNNLIKQRPISGFMYGHVVHIFYYSFLWCVISMIWGFNTLLWELHAIRNWNKERNDMVCYTMVYYDISTKKSRYTEVFQTFQSEKIVRQCLPLICNVNMIYAMLCYDIWQMKIYEIVCYVWDSNAMKFKCNDMLWYVCCKGYA